MDIYVPVGVKQAPAVVVAHGFSRSRVNMAGWGRLLASNGFIVGVPDLPAWADSKRNSRAISELLDLLNSGELVQEPRPTGSGALVGFSMGGLSTLLAAAVNTNACCWVGLDPVDGGRAGVAAAKRLEVPCLVLRAEPAAWNGHGNSRQIIAVLSTPLLALQVEKATHSDPENPTDSMAELMCGKADPQRRLVFERYAVAGLRAVFFGEGSALDALRAATNDPAVKEVAIRRIEEFSSQRRKPGS